MTTKAQQIRDQLKAAVEAAYGGESVLAPSRHAQRGERDHPERVGFRAKIDSKVVHVVVFLHEDRPWKGKR